MKNNNTLPYDTAFIIRNRSRRFLSSSETNTWGTIDESQLFDNYFAACEVAGRTNGACVRHVMLKSVNR